MLFRARADNLVVIQQRAPVQGGHQGQFAKDMLKYMFTSAEIKAPEQVLILASANAAMRRDQFIQGEQVALVNLYLVFLQSQPALQTHHRMPVPPSLFLFFSISTDTTAKSQGDKPR